MGSVNTQPRVLQLIVSLPSLILSVCISRSLLHSFHVTRSFFNMALTKASRLTLDELDGNWAHKFCLRVVMSVLCGLSIGACGYTLSQRLGFQSEAWKEDREVLLFLPYVRDTRRMD